jgi:hypothetical protein
MTINETFKGYITSRLDGNDGVVNICQRDITSPIRFNNDGRISGGIVNINYNDKHLGEIELHYIDAPYKKYLDQLKHVEGQFGAISGNINPTTSKQGYFSLFEALLKKFPDEIYVLIDYGGCYCFDNKKKFQGIFTFYNTGLGYLKCEIPIYKLAKKRGEFYNGMHLQGKINNLNHLQRQVEHYTKFLEENKIAVEAYKNYLETETKNLKKDFGYLDQFNIEIGVNQL